MPPGTRLMRPSVITSVPETPRILAGARTIAPCTEGDEDHLRYLFIHMNTVHNSVQTCGRGLDLLELLDLPFLRLLVPGHQDQVLLYLHIISLVY